MGVGGVVEVKAERGRGGVPPGCLALSSIAYHCHLICPSLLPPSRSPHSSPLLSRSAAAERSGGKEGQTEIRADRMMECAPLLNRIRGEKEGEEVGADVAFKTNKGK